MFYDPTEMRHKCAERGCFIEAQPDWSWIKESFTRGVRPTDVDAFVEVDGSFLFIEGKGAGAPIPNGQRIALKRLAQQDYITVVVLRYSPGDAEAEWMVWGDCRYLARPTDGFTKVSLQHVQAWMRHWYERARDLRSARVA